jgi:hypothetical protein
MRTGRKTKDGDTRQYVLAGLVVCGACGRRMDAHWIHGRPGYRCRHGYSSAVPRPGNALRNVYVREERLLELLPGMLPNTGGTRSCPIAGGPEVDLVEGIRQQRLQIVCSPQGQELRRGASRDTAYPPGSQDQAALALDLTSSNDVACQPDGATGLP